MQLHLFRLLQLLALSLPCIAYNSSQLVHDIYGKKLRIQSDYYILPAKRAIGGGLLPYAAGVGYGCLHYVRVYGKTGLGTPVRFTPLNPLPTGEIPISSNIAMEFIDPSNPPDKCTNSLDWYITSKDTPKPSSGPFVAAGHSNGKKPLRKVFRIETHNAELMEYKLVWCDSQGVGAVCKNLGLPASSEFQWLTVNDEPLGVVFQEEN